VRRSTLYLFVWDCLICYVMVLYSMGCKGRRCELREGTWVRYRMGDEEIKWQVLKVTEESLHIRGVLGDGLKLNASYVRDTIGRWMLTELWLIEGDDSMAMKANGWLDMFDFDPNYDTSRLVRREVVRVDGKKLRLLVYPDVIKSPDIPIFGIYWARIGDDTLKLLDFGYK